MQNEKHSGDDFTVDGATLTALLLKSEREGKDGMTDLQKRIVTAIEDNHDLKRALVKTCRKCGKIVESANSFNGWLCGCGHVEVKV